MIPALAPLLATLAANGLSLIANAVMAKGQQVVEDKLGVKLDTMVTTDEGRIKLMQIQAEKEKDLHDFILEQREQELKSDKMAYEDIASARRREVEIATSANAPHVNKVITSWLAIGVLGLTFVLFGTVLFAENEVSPTRKDLIIYILGVLSAISTQVIGYYFGSSKGSQVKDETIRKLSGEQ